MSALPWLLLTSTLLVRFLLARKHRSGFYIDLLTVPAWAFLYISQGLWPLLPVPLIFGAMDVYALRTRWRHV